MPEQVSEVGAEQATTAQAGNEGGATKETPSLEELQTALETERTRNAELEKKLGYQEKDNRGKDTAITNLMKKIEQSNSQIELLSHKIGILGQGDTADGTVDEKLAKADAKYKQDQQVVTQQEYESHVTDKTKEITKILTDAGLDIEGDSKEVQRVQKAWENAIKSGQPLDYVVDLAQAAADFQSNLSQKTEEIEKEAKEKLLSSNAMKTPMASSAGSSNWKQLSPYEKILHGSAVEEK